jgi:hypothetical protein
MYIPYVFCTRCEMESPARKDRVTQPDARIPVDAGSPDTDADTEELEFFRHMAKVARRTSAKEIDRLFGPAE